VAEYIFSSCVASTLVSDVVSSVEPVLSTSEEAQLQDASIVAAKAEIINILIAFFNFI
jgi:hypothetical protein